MPVRSATASPWNRLIATAASGTTNAYTRDTRAENSHNGSAGSDHEEQECHHQSDESDGAVQCRSDDRRVEPAGATSSVLRPRAS